MATVKILLVATAVLVLTCKYGESVFQIIEYKTTPPGVSGCNGNTMEVEVFYTSPCDETACVTDGTWAENWYCSDTEPDPYSFFPNGFVIEWFNDDTCTTSTDVHWMVTTPECLYDYEYEDQAYVHVCNPTSAQLTRVSYNDAQCRGSQSSSSYIDRPWSTSPSTPGCYDGRTSGDYYTLSCAKPNPAYQVIKGYTYQDGITFDVCDTGDLMSVMVYYTTNCAALGCVHGSNNVNELWECVTTEPTAASFFENPIVATYYSASDCSGTVAAWRAFNPDCSVDTFNDNGYYFTCQDDTVSRIRADPTCQEIYRDSLTVETENGGNDGCWYSNSVQHYYSLSCGEGAYQVTEVTTIDPDDPLVRGEMLYVTSVWNDNCLANHNKFYGVDQATYCVASDPEPGDFFVDVPAIVSFFTDNTCTTAHGWVGYTTYCAYDTSTTGTLYVDCEPDIGKLSYMQCDDNYCQSDSCSSGTTIISNLYNENAGCFFSESMDAFYTVSCSPRETKWQVTAVYPDEECEDFALFQEAKPELFCYIDECMDELLVNGEEYGTSHSCRDTVESTSSEDEETIGVTVYQYSDRELCTPDTLEYFANVRRGLCWSSAVNTLDFYVIECDQVAQTATISSDCEDSECLVCHSTQTVDLGTCENGKIYYCSGSTLKSAAILTVVLTTLLFALLQ